MMLGILVLIWSVKRWALETVGLWDLRFSMESLLRTVDIFLPFRLPMVAEHF